MALRNPFPGLVAVAVAIVGLFVFGFLAMSGQTLTLPSSVGVVQNTTYQNTIIEATEVTLLYTAEQAAGYLTAEELDELLIVETAGVLVLPSARHGEFEQIKISVNTSVNNGRVERKGDGRSNGSVTLYIGVGLKDFPGQGYIGNPNLGTVIIVKRVQGYTQFAAAKVNLAQGMWGTQGWEKIGTSNWYMDVSSMQWTAGWWLSKRPFNGKATPKQEHWLDIGQSEAKLQYYFTLYNQVFEVASVPWPSWLK